MIDLDEDIIAQRRLEDQRRLSVQRLLWGKAQLGIGLKPPLESLGVFADSWDFPSLEAALQAMEAWKPEETSEPQGWHRHSFTGRYRIGGNKDLEYVKVDGDINERMRRATIATHGQERIIVEINEEEGVLGTLFPQGSQYFRVLSESSECGHDPRCQWWDIVYHYLDRCVVVRVEDVHRITLKVVLQRLTGELFEAIER